MRQWLTLLIAGAVMSGCATTTPDPWLTVEVPAGKAETPLDLPRWPLPDEVTDGAVTYYIDGLIALDAYRETSRTNTRIAEAHAGEINALRSAVGNLTEAGKHQRRIADMRAEALADERRARLWSSVEYWLIIIALAAAL